MAGYWEIDDFLAGEELISISEISEELLPHLSDSSSSNMLKLTVPLWLAKILERHDLCKIPLPIYLSEPFRLCFLAHPDLLNLSNFSFNFYYLASFLSCKDSSLSHVLVQMFLIRAKKMLKNVGIENVSREILKVDRHEVKLFKLLMKSSKEKNDWKERKHEKIEKSFIGRVDY